MCVMNSKGDIVYGGSFVSLLRNGQTQPQLISNNADLGVFLTDDVIAYQYGLDIQPVAVVKTTDGRQLNNFGASNIYAGGNDWVINYGANLYIDSGRVINPANRGGVGFDGMRVYQGPNYIGVFGDNGLSAPNDIATYIHCIDRNAVMWTLGTKQVRFYNGIDYFTYNVNVPINYARIFRLDNKVFIIYNGDFLYIHDITDCTQGWKVTGPTFNADALQVSGQVKVAYSLTQGETDQSIKTTIINASTPMEKYSTIVVPPVRDFPPYDKKIWSACWFSITNKYDTTPIEQYIGNCAILADETTLSPIAAQRGLPIFSSIKEYDPRYENLQISFISMGEQGYRDSISNKYPIKPQTVYVDSDNWPDTPPNYWIRQRTWALIKAYRLLNESLTDFDKRMVKVLDRVASYNLPGMGLAMQAYDENGTMPIELAMQQYDLYDAWIRKYRMILAFAFADRRPGGMLNYPAIKPYVNSIFKVTVRPTRNDYWSPSELDKSRVQQDVIASVGLSQDEKVYINGLIEKDKP